MATRAGRCIVLGYTATGAIVLFLVALNPAGAVTYTPVGVIPSAALPPAA